MTSKKPKGLKLKCEECGHPVEMGEEGNEWLHVVDDKIGMDDCPEPACNCSTPVPSCESIYAQGKADGFAAGALAGKKELVDKFGIYLETSRENKTLTTGEYRQLVLVLDWLKSQLAEVEK